MPWLLDKRPADDIKQCAADGIVVNEGNVPFKVCTYRSRMKRISRHCRTCKRVMSISAGLIQIDSIPYEFYGLWAEGLVWCACMLYRGSNCTRVHTDRGQS